MKPILTLSRTEFESFCGDVATLRIQSDQDLSREPVEWSSDNPARVRVCSCAGDGPECFSDGVLLALLGEGEARVTASLGGESAVCRVTVRPLRHASPEEPMHWYAGDTHAHTGFSDGASTPADAFERVRREGALDFFTISDHGNFFTPRRIFETLRAAEENTTPAFVAIAAQEANLALESTDDYGLQVNQGGELLTLQGEGWADVRSWDSYFAAVGPNPLLMAGIPHPSDIGSSERVIWNGFDLAHCTQPRFRERLRFIEVLNSPTFEAYNLLNERIFSQALDYGCRVCPTAGSDTHSWNWGEGAMWSRTVVLAPELTREAILDAFQSGRVYTTESGNVRLRFQVNGVHPGGTIPAASSYLADFSFDVFRPANETERIVRAELFSDYGEAVDSIELNRIRGNYTLGCQNRNARYFYLRLTDAAGDRTWSSPIRTENAPDAPLPRHIGRKLPRDECRVLSAEPGRHPQKLMNGNPEDGWLSERSSARILLDLGRVRRVCGMGYYHHFVEIKNCAHVASLLAGYEIETSADGVYYERACRGNMRSYGGEQTIPFPVREARYLRFTALSSVGVQRGTPQYRNSPVAIGELAVYEEETD